MVQPDGNGLVATHRHAEDGAVLRLAAGVKLLLYNGHQAFDDVLADDGDVVEIFAARALFGATRHGRVAEGHDEQHGPRLAVGEEVVHDQICPAHA